MTYHKELADGKWFKLSLVEQLANIGSEVLRAISWEKKDKNYSKLAAERGIELIDLTISDPKNRKRLKEICRLRELVCDYFFFDNEYRSDEKQWENYFCPFMVYVRKKRYDVKEK
ncbi:MAG TPA: hypothetical protein PLW95_07675 [bacterium]|nr:hypothetical protein [bacterium]